MENMLGNAGNDIDNTPDTKKSALSEFIEFLELFVIAISLVIVVFSCFVRLCVVDGPSMENTLYHGERLLVSEFFYEPEVNDIVVFHQTGKYYNQPIVKRVIAVGGEKVHIEYGKHTMQITVTDANGKDRILEEPYIKMVDADIYSSPLTVEVPEGKLFVLGDNRNHSSDSRAYTIGLVDERRVLGRVFFRVLPIPRFGTVN